MMIELTPEQWNAFRELPARIRRMSMALSAIQADGAALALDILASTPGERRDSGEARRVFHIAADCQRGLLDKSDLEDEPDFYPTLAILPEIIDRARETMG